MLFKVLGVAVGVKAKVSFPSWKSILRPNLQNKKLNLVEVFAKGFLEQRKYKFSPGNERSAGCQDEPLIPGLNFALQYQKKHKKDGRLYFATCSIGWL